MEERWEKKRWLSRLRTHKTVFLYIDGCEERKEERK